MEAILKIHEVVVKFGGLIAVNSVSFDVERGQITSLIGPNGAGKTTLFNSITGNNNPTSGSVSMGHIELIGKPSNKICELGISRTFQNLRLFHELTVLQNVLIGRYVRTKSGVLSTLLNLSSEHIERQESLEKAEAILEWIGLGEKKYLLAKNLPYGEQKLVEVARALATEPKILLLDEPVAGMNAQETNVMVSVLRNIIDQGITILLVEHDMKMVMEISKLIVVLNYGRLIAKGSPLEVRSNKEVIDAYLGSDDDLEGISYA